MRCFFLFFYLFFISHSFLIYNKSIKYTLHICGRVMTHMHTHTQWLETAHLTLWNTLQFLFRIVTIVLNEQLIVKFAVVSIPVPHFTLSIPKKSSSILNIDLKLFLFQKGNLQILTGEESGNWINQYKYRELKETYQHWTELNFDVVIVEEFHKQLAMNRTVLKGTWQSPRTFRKWWIDMSVFSNNRQIFA